MTGQKRKIVSLVGARPQFIKLAALENKLSKKFRHIIVHSGQHYDFKMSEIFFRQLQIPRPQYNLAVGSETNNRMTAAIMIHFEKLLVKLKPDLILVYGDTNTTLAGALTAAGLNIPLGHIEAGMRSFDKGMPEEINRRLTDHVSDLLFCPTTTSMKNLHREGIKSGVVYSGDLMYELLQDNKDKLHYGNRLLRQYNLTPHQYVYFTVHRAANVDSREKLLILMAVLKNIKMNVIFPVHPRTRKNLIKFKLLTLLKNFSQVILIEPLSYMDNLIMINNARAVLSDSGGIQKEAVFLGTPCLTLRDETEWVETLENGNYLTGLSEKKIFHRLSQLPEKINPVVCKINNRKPSAIINSALQKFLG